MNRTGVIAACVAAAAIALGLTFFRPSEDDRIRQTLTRIAKAVAVKPDDNVVARAGRIRSELKDTATDDVGVDVPDFAIRVTGRRQVADAAAQASAVFSSATCELTSLKIQIDESVTQAQVDGVALVTANRGGERKIDKRDVHFLLRKDDGTWKVRTIDVMGIRAD